MERAIIYARVSTDTQRDNFSIPSQVSECQKYILKCGYALVGDLYVNTETGRDAAVGTPAFVDDLSSRELVRPGLDAAITYLETIGFDVVIVHALDRLARDPYVRQTLEREFIRRGARVEYALGNYEETPEGEVRKDLDATFAKWENTKRVERCNRGKKRKAETGKFVAGRAPYGYRIDPTATGGLSINEDEAEIVGKIYSLYVVDGYSIKQISKNLTDEAIQTHQGGEAWGFSSVRNILLNSTYAGYFYYNKYIRKGDKLALRDKSEWIRIEVTPIIENWAYQHAQNRLAENREIRKRRPTRFYLLTGMITCADCERPYISQTALAGRSRRANDASFYRHRIKNGHCSNHTISARVLEPIVWGEIVTLLMEPEQLKQGYLEALEQQKLTISRQMGLLSTLKERLFKYEKQRQNLTALYIDPDMGMTKDDYLEQKGRIDNECKSISAEIEQVEIDIKNAPLPMGYEDLATFSQVVREGLEANEEPKPEDKRLILDSLHVRIILDGVGNCKITGWFDKEIEVCTGLKTKTS
jgi:site-specific DNA recombinase